MALMQCDQCATNVVVLRTGAGTFKVDWTTAVLRNCREGQDKATVGTLQSRIECNSLSATIDDALRDGRV